MIIRKIKDFKPARYCNHPEHNPPPMQVFSPGLYENTCPGCGKKKRFIVQPQPQLRVFEPSVVVLPQREKW